eukprot:5029879-Amphidinium_carterae.1
MKVHEALFCKWRRLSEPGLQSFCRSKEVSLHCLQFVYVSLTERVAVGDSGLGSVAPLTAPSKNRSAKRFAKTEEDKKPEETSRDCPQRGNTNLVKRAFQICSPEFLQCCLSLKEEVCML